MSAEPVDLDDLEVPDYPGDEASLLERQEFHANRLRWYRNKVAAKEAERDRMVERYREWCEQVTASWRRKMAESEAFLVYSHLDAVDSDPKHPRVLHLPSATLRYSAPRPSVVVDDPEAFRIWVSSRDDVEELSRWKCEANKPALKKVLEDGEIVDGVRLEMGERKVHVSLEDDE